MTQGVPEDGARYIPVQRVRPGDHAFTAYDSASQQWAQLGAFVRQGVTAGEKVLVFLAPEVTAEQFFALLGDRTPALDEAWQRGQLTLSSMRALLHPHREFTAQLQWQRLLEAADGALCEGYPATRAYIDMAWVADLGTDVGAVERRECGAWHLFDGRPYSEVCAYDERCFDADVLERMLAAHPKVLLDAVGSLRAEQHGPPGTPTLRLTGEADVCTSDEFHRALRTALEDTARRHPQPGRPHHDAGHPPTGAALTVDLTTLHFLSAGCAADLLRLIAEAGTPVTVNCRPFQARTLRRLGSDAIRALHLTVGEAADAER